MSRTVAVGIDLGTTYSVAAYVDRYDRTAMIHNDDGDVLTPSVVLFGDEEIVVGKDAKKAGILQPDRYAECVKRDMGSPSYSKAIGGTFLPPEVIQAFILKRLRHDIERVAGAANAVVITVPAFFDEPRRRATAIAGDIAGLNVIDIINEPTAGALAIGEHLGLLDGNGHFPNAMTVLVYDLGGGTFDVTLVEITHNSFRTIATDGDVRLGGRDWDLRLVDLVSQQFITKHREDPRTNQISLQRLLREVEYAKHSLSVRQHGRVRVDHAGISTEIEVSRQEFEEVTADLLERTAHTARHLLKESGIQSTDVGEILLVGGASRMPMVATMLEAQFSRKPVAMVNPDEANARGAALYAQHRLDAGGAESRIGSITITNVNAHSLGIKGVEHDTARSVNAILIPRNTALPARSMRTFATRRYNQRSVAVSVLEGESTMPGETSVIGRTVVRDLPPKLPKGHPVNITYAYSASGRLLVTAKVPGTDRVATLELERQGAIGEWTLDRWRQVVNDANPTFESFRARALKCLAHDELSGEWAKTDHDDDASFIEEAESDRAVSRGMEKPVALPDDAEQASRETEATYGVEQSRTRRRRFEQIVNVIGHIVFSVLGLMIGYYVLHRWKGVPLPNWVRHWLPWLP